MATKISRKELKHDEIAEAAFDFGHWVEHNWRTVAGGAGAVAVIVIAIVAWSWMAAQKRAESERMLGNVIAAYSKAEAGSFADDNELSSALYAAEELGEKFPGTAAADVALYYRAATLQHLGRASEAIETVEQLLEGDPDPSTLRGTAELLLVNLYVESGRATDAVARLQSNIDGPGSGLPKEAALLRLGEIEKGRGDTAAARAAWRRVLDEYPDSAASGEARRQLGPDA